VRQQFNPVSPSTPSCSQTQVAAQIKVRDLSRCTVTASPAGYSSWNEARSELCARRLDAALPPRARAHPLSLVLAG